LQASLLVKKGEKSQQRENMGIARASGTIIEDIFLILLVLCNPESKTESDTPPCLLHTWIVVCSQAASVGRGVSRATDAPA
jgi:hypothetical protein